MESKEWQEILGWGSDELTDLRYAAYCYIQQGIYDVALSIFEALNVLAPPTAYDLQSMGAIYLQQGNGLKALEFLDKALKMDPSHLPTQLNRAKALFLLGYRKQGLTQTLELEKSLDPAISEAATALSLAYR
jgi:tetratricopeptide (TPR) repeat protein